MLGSRFYLSDERSVEILKDKSRVIELKELIDSERLAKKNFKLQVKLLEIKIKKIENERKGYTNNIKLPKLSSPISIRSRFNTNSLTPHPKLKYKFN